MGRTVDVAEHVHHLHCLGGVQGTASARAGQRRGYSVGVGRGMERTVDVAKHVHHLHRLGGEGLRAVLGKHGAQRVDHYLRRQLAEFGGTVLFREVVSMSHV